MQQLPKSVSFCLWCCVVAGFFFSSAVLAQPADVAKQRQEQVEQSRRNLKGIALALGKNLPTDFAKRAYPAGYSNQDGKLILSWRVAILPALGEEELWKQFRLDQPWDSEHNRKLITKMPTVFKAVRGETKEGHTYYRGFAGDEAMFPLKSSVVERVSVGDRSFFPVFCRPFIKTPDGTSFTFLIAEGGETVPWTKPDELTYDAKQPLPKLGGLFDGDFNALACDGVSRLMSRTITEPAMRAAITCADGQTLRFKPAENSFTIEIVTPQMQERMYAVSKMTAASPHVSTAQISDGPNETLIGGIAPEGRAVPWTKPDDLIFDETFPAKENALVEGSVMFADGAVRHLQIQEGLDRAKFRALFTIAGKEAQPLSSLYPPNHKFVQPSYPTPQEQIRHTNARSKDSSNLKTLVLAMHNHQQVYGYFPAATVFGPDGKPWHSWRVALLPFLGLQNLYEEYDGTVPWDHPKNAAVLNKMPAVYRDPLSDKADSNKTRYLLVTGAGTVFPTKPAGNVIAQAPTQPNPAQPAPPKPVAKDGRQPIEYQPFRPDVWKAKNQSTWLFPWEGERVVLLTTTADLDPKTMAAFVKQLDAAWKLCGEIVGQSPALNKQHKGKVTIAAVPDLSFTLNVGNKFGFGFYGSGGIEVAEFYGPQGDFERFRKDPEQFPDHYFLLIGQNHAVAMDRMSFALNGSAMLLRHICTEGVKSTDSETQARQSVVRYENAFAQSKATFAESFVYFGAKTPLPLNDIDGKPFAGGDLSLLFASCLLKVRQENGGNEWVKRFYRHLSECPPVVARQANELASVANGQLLNWVVAASLAAGKDLSPLFRDRWRFPLAPGVWQALKAVDWKKSGLTADNVFDALPIEHLHIGVAMTRPGFLTSERRKQNLLVGGTFEGDAASKWKLDSFRANLQSGAMEGGVVKEGQKAAVLRTTINDDTRFTQTVTIKPGTRYLLSGWIKTKDVEIDKVDRTYGKAGATLSIWGGYEHSRSLVGTNDWTYSTLIFDSRDRTEVAVLARLGYWYSTASGEAWFDDLCLIPIGESPVSPAAQSPPPAPGPAEKDNLLVNGSFEEGPGIPENYGYLPNVRAGSTDIKGWTVTRGNIDVVGRRLWIAGHGQRSIDLHGTPGFGGVKQTFKTVVGQRYQVSFLMSGTPKESISLFKLAVRAADKQQEFSFDATGKSPTQMGWTRKTWDFVAVSAETTLEIHTLQTTAPSYGPVIDDVSVVALGTKAPGQPLKAEDVPTKSAADWKGWSKDTPPPAIAPFNAEQAKQHQEAWAKHLGVPVEYTNSIGMKFRLIPPGEFLMGSTAEEVEAALSQEGLPRYVRDCIQNEAPQHKVILTQPIYFGLNEVTQAEYEAVIGKNPSHFAPQGRGKDAVTGLDTKNHPIETVGWTDAVEFCESLARREGRLQKGLGYRLPTEAEWEFACRAGTTTKYWTGDNEDNLRTVAWYDKASGQRTHPVGELKANPFGLLDIHGNVWEWVQDGWDLNYYEQFREKTAIDPIIQPLASSKRVFRGGNWFNNASACRSSSRIALDFNPPYRHYHLGIRVALSVEAVKNALANPVKAEAPPVENHAKELLTLKGHTGGVASVAFSPDGKRLASASIGKSVKVWDTNSGQVTHTLEGHTAAVSSVAFSPDGKRLASASGDSTVKLWDTTSGQETLTLKGDRLPVDSVAFCLDGKRLASSTHDGTVRVWDTTSGQETLTLRTGHTATLLSMAFSQDGKRLATSSLDKTVKVWDATSGQESLTLNGQTNWFFNVAFSPDGKRLASASRDQTVKVWDATSGQETLTLKGHTGAIRSVAYSADGKWLASASSDQTAKVWDATSGQEMLTLKGHTGQVLSVAFSPDGKRLASASLDGTVKVWDVTPQPADNKDRKNAAQDWKGWPKDAPPSAIAPFNAEQAKQHQEAWAKHLGVPVEYMNSIGMRFRLIPPGEFLMGNTSERIEAELKSAGGDAAFQASLRSQAPQHRVILTQPIYLGAHEVTQGNFESVTGNKPSHFAATGAGREAVNGLETTQHPVDSVSWNDVAEFCVKLSEREKLKPFDFRSSVLATSQRDSGYRLPTEAEWERACRAGTVTTFWPGNTFTELSPAGWFGTNSQKRTHAVGTLRANPFGLYDVHGNVWEWVLDSLDLNYYQRFENEPALDPTGPTPAGPRRGLRGGGWQYTSRDLWASFRHSEPPTLRHPSVGFRVALSVAAVKSALTKPVQAEITLKADDDLSALTLKTATRGFTSVVFSPDGKQLVSGSIERAVKVWDAASGKEQLTMSGGFCAVFSPDGKLLASAGPENSVKIWNAATGQETLTLKGHTGDVRSVAFSADGKRVASASADRSVKVWDAASGQELLTLKGHTDDVRSVAFSPDGSRLASASKDLTIKVWDVARGAEVRTLRGHTGEIRCVTFSPDGKRLASAGHDPIVRLWDVATGANIMQQGHHSSGVMGIAFSPDGKWLATAGCDQTLRISGVSIGLEQVVLSGHTSQVVGVAWSPDGNRLASASYDGTLKVWDVSLYLSRPALLDSRKPVTRAVPAEEVSLAADAAKTARPLTNGTFVAGFAGWQLEGGANEFRHFPLPQTTETAMTTAGLNKDPITGRLYQCFKVPADATELRFSVHGGADSQSTYIALWDGIQQHHRTAARNDNTPFDVAWNVVPLRNKVVTLEVVDRSAFAWGFIGVHGFKLVTQQEVASKTVNRPTRVTQATQDDPLTVSLRGHEYAVLSLAVSPDGKSLASGDLYGSVMVWNVADRKLKFELPGTPGANIVGLAFSPDGKLIATGNGKSVKLWDSANGQELKTFNGHTDQIWSVAFSPDSKRLASGSHDKSVKVWDIAKGEEITKLTGKDGAFLSVSFSPDGKWLAGATSYGESYVMLWDTNSWKESQRLSPINGQVWSIAFSPDSQRLVTANDSGRAAIWDVQSGDELLSLQDRQAQRGRDHTQSHHDKQMKSVAFNHDGSRIATAADSGSIKIWDAKTGQKLHELSGHANEARGAVFSPDDKWLASGGGDSLVKIWTLAERPKAASDGTIVKALVDPQKAQTEWQSLQGTWRLTNAADFANRLPSELDINDAHLVIKGETATLLIKNFVQGYLLTIDPTQSPKAFDMLGADDLWRESLSMGIFSLDRDTLQIAWQPDALGRPKELKPATTPANESPDQPAVGGMAIVLKFERLKEPLPRVNSVFDLASWQKASRELNKLRVRVQLGKFEPLDQEESAGPGYIGVVDLPLSETDGTVPSDVWKAASSVNFILGNVSGLTDATLRQLTTHRGLYGLGLSGKSSATKDGLSLLKALPKFEYLSLTEVPQTVEILTALAESSDLRMIEISGASPSSELLAAIARFKNLEVLMLNEIDLTDDILIELAKLPNLRKLSLQKSKKFNFDKPEVSDKALQAVKTMKKLKRLEIIGHGIDNLKLHEINEQLRAPK